MNIYEAVHLERELGPEKRVDAVIRRKAWASGHYIYPAAGTDSFRNETGEEEDVTHRDCFADDWVVEYDDKEIDHA